MSVARPLSGWGRMPVLHCRVETPRDESEAAALVAEGPLIARGAGRAYGDAALNPARTLSTARLNRMLAFDPETGLLTAEAGVVLGDVVTSFLPRGWFPPVTPGTRFVTLGGMIAADVHGKNHHVAGGFGAHVEWLDLLTAEGVTRCSRGENAELFAATVGGMGLTGVILRAAFRLIPVETGWIRQRTVVAPDLDAAMAAFEAAEDATYSVAWIDCLASGRELGRSLVMVGEHAGAGELGDRPAMPPRRKRLRAPLDAPGWALNRWSVKGFNAAYWAAGQRGGDEKLVDWEGYFYPLDAIEGWNRIYGRRGFVQFQCVLPPETAREGLREILGLTSSEGLGAFLAVLKKFGRHEGALSFPREGYTLALDFPGSPPALKLARRLHGVAIRHGGRFYLAKDALLTRAELDASDPRATSFRDFRARSGADRAFRSALSERLGL